MLCALADIADPGARGFDFRAGEDLFAGFVARKDSGLYGYVDLCPHAGWPLAALPDRYLTRDADRILCFGHGALFRIDDGVCTAGPCVGARLQPWPVQAGADGLVRTR